jgi:sarcosine oxidase subunit gamma
VRVKRSFLARKLGGVATAPAALSLADLSLLPRSGFKGRGAPDWLAANGVASPPAPNLATRQADGALVARLSNEEHLVLAPLSGDDAVASKLDSAWSLDAAPGCYRLPRADSHAWLAVAGAEAATMLAKICGVDLRPRAFANHAIAQTSLARISAIVIRDDLGDVLAYHLLCDSASAEYLWDCLLDAMAEFDGAPVTHDALRRLGSQ